MTRSPRSDGSPRPTRSLSRRGGAALAGLLAVAAAVSVAAVSAAADPAPGAGDAPDLALPAPTGARTVGVTSLHLVDEDRADPWVPEEDRELMVSLWYPAHRKDAERARYMTPKESELLLNDAGITDVDPAVLSTTRIHAFRDAEPAGRAGRVPLVVLSPGYKKPRSTLTGLAEELVSHGYAVAAIDHTYENTGTTFPDGRVTTCVSCEREDRDEEFWRILNEGRVDDVSFVLDELTGGGNRGKAAALIDPKRIAMVGHSAGGSAALTTLGRDDRVLAGLGIDGVTDGGLPEDGVDRPFLFLGTADKVPGQVPSWDRDWELLTGWKRWLVASGAEHASFTDVGLLAGRLGVETGADMSGDRGAELTRTYVRTFLDLHLRGKRTRLLNGPSRAFPEVTRCVPGGAECAPEPKEESAPARRGD